MQNKVECQKTTAHRQTVCRQSACSAAVSQTSVGVELGFHVYHGSLQSSFTTNVSPQVLNTYLKETIKSLQYKMFWRTVAVFCLDSDSYYSIKGFSGIENDSFCIKPNIFFGDTWSLSVASIVSLSITESNKRAVVKYFINEMII